MAAIKDLREISQKWARVTPQRAGDYAAGVKNPRRDWGQETAAASDRYAQGVTEAINNGSFERGVTKAGTEKWQRKASSVGAQRFGPGVQAAQGDYEQGFAPFAEVIRNTNLPPRFPKGDPRNIERVSAIAEALHSKKVQG